MALETASQTGELASAGLNVDRVAFAGGAGRKGSCNCHWRFECKLQLPLAI